MCPEGLFDVVALVEVVEVVALRQRVSVARSCGALDRLGLAVECTAQQATRCIQYPTDVARAVEAWFVLRLVASRHRLVARCVLVDECSFDALERFRRRLH